MDQITPFLGRRAVKILPVETQGGINLGRVVSVQERAWILQAAVISKFAIIIRRLLVQFWSYHSVVYQYTFYVFIIFIYIYLFNKDNVQH